MIESPERLYDIQKRNECLELMELCLFNGDYETAKEFGRMSAIYAEDIEKNDYTERDKKWAIYHKLSSPITSN